MTTLDAPVSLASGATGGGEGLVGWVLDLMESLGEVGVGLAVLAETFVPPIPSEAVLPVAGYLAYQGRMDPWLAIVTSTLGSLVGAWIWWGIGAAFGRHRTRAVVDRIPLLDGDDYDRSERFFRRHGRAAVLFGRCVPLVRSFISIPAGIDRMPLVSFTLCTVVGSLVWNGLWIGLGYGLGPAVEPALDRWSGLLSKVVVIGLAALALLFVGTRLRRNARARSAESG